MEKLSQLEPLAPLHQPHNLSGIRTCAALRPHVPQVVCFDTAFHQTMDPVARRFGLPRAYDNEGVRRYGFHGLSYEFIAQRLRAIDPDLARGRVIVAHLGNGASLCATRDGRSVDTTMSFTDARGTTPASVCARARQSARRPSIRCRAGGSRPVMEKHSCRTRSSNLPRLDPGAESLNAW